MEYRRRPGIVSAHYFDGSDASGEAIIENGPYTYIQVAWEPTPDLSDLSGNLLASYYKDPFSAPAPEGRLVDFCTIFPGEWVVKEENGSMIVCSDEAFHRMYEACSSEVPGGHAE